MASSLSLFCVLSNLPGPPLVHFQNFSLQLWPVSRRKCAPIDPDRDVLFNLYTRQNPLNEQIIKINDDESLDSSNIEFENPTIVFFHGFMESHLADNAQSLKNAYLQKGDYNVILIQAERLLAGPEYITAAGNCKPIGKYAAGFIDYLVTKGLQLRDLHVIGMSLGGQISGLTGQFVKSGKLPRITGLDPAGPLFTLAPEEERLDPSDAEFVDVIHANAGVFGIIYDVGHANFWPNGGTKQPGCAISEIVGRYGFALNQLLFCNHYRAYQLYIQSINDPFAFPVRKCNSYIDYKEGLCQSGDIAYMGIAANPNDRGDYFLDTGLSVVNI